jgi:hypothetical protein
MFGQTARLCALVALVLSSAASIGASPPEYSLHPEIASRLRASASRLFESAPRASLRDRLSGKRAPASLSVLVVGVDFSDSLLVGRSNAMPEFAGWPAQRRQSERIAGTDLPMFSAHDADYLGIQMRKVADYFATVSFGQFQLDWDVHPELVNVGRFADDPRTRMGWYGDDDSSNVRLVDLSRDVIERIDATVDFSLYDTLILVHAGAGQETDILGDSPEQIFSNYLDRRDFEAAVEAGYLAEPRLIAAEADVEHVLILPESESQDPFPAAGFFGFFDTRGVFCFELGLRLGMLNLGDFTPAGRPDSQGVGNFCLMGYGLFTGLGIVPSAPSAINRQLMGWVPRVDVRESADLRLGAMGPAGAAVSDTLLVRVPISDREYFLLEYRLQDADGDLFFSFDDLNGNRLPDFFDADSAFGDGTPTGPFDAGSDLWESTLGAEWDWFMSENDARSPDRCMRAGGSGLYIWHIDERVIVDSIENGENSINADPRRKGVDVEEADGIQDLDSPRPSPFFLGWDGDAWRGEGAAAFGPASDPSTASADGTPTGIRIESISNVASDTTRVDGICQQILFRPSIEFRVEFAGAPSASIQAKATRRLVDLAPVGEPKLADLSAPGLLRDGVHEIVQAGEGGVVYAFRGDLSEWRDGDQDPQTTGILARATAATTPRFRAAPALGDLDGDGHDEIVLLSDDGIYAFGADGSEFRDGDLDPSTFGLVFGFAQPGVGVGPPVLQAGRVLVLRHLDAATAQLLVFDPLSQTAASAERAATQLGDGLALTDVAGALGVAFSFVADGASGVAIYAAANLSAPPVLLPSTPQAGLGMAAWAREDGTSLFWLEEGAMLREQDAAGSRPARRAPSTPSPLSAPVLAPIGPQSGSGVVHAFAAGPTLQLLDANLRPRDGFPYRADLRGARLPGAVVQAAPLLVDLDGDDRVEAIWSDPVGRIHAVDLSGKALPGYPLLGPAEPLGSPAVGQLDADAELELVVAGRFGELVDVDAPSRSVRTRAVGTLATYDLPAAASNFAPWPQGRADAANRAYQALLGSSGTAAAAGSFAPGSLFVHPHPATGSALRVRVQLRRSAAVRATLYNLEGEVVAEGPTRDAVGGGAYDESIDISRLASGFYVCRVHDGSDSVRIPFTVVR